MEQGIELKHVDQSPPKKSPQKKVSFFEKPEKQADESSKILEKVDWKKDDNTSKYSIDEKPTSGANKWKFFMYIILLMIHILLVYIVKPLCVVLEIVFLSLIVDVKANTTDGGNSTLISSRQRIGGWIILFVIPLYNMFFGSGMKIVAVKKYFFGRTKVLVLLLIEIMFNFPLTFLYDNNLFSIFLFEEKGIKQLLNPWLVFFPTEYSFSVFEILRNFLDPVYFLIIGFYKLTEIQNNPYQVYFIIVLQVMLVMCILRALGNIILFSLKLKRCCSKSDKEAYDSNEKNSDEKENDLKASGEENTKDKKEL